MDISKKTVQLETWKFQLLQHRSQWQCLEMLAISVSIGPRYREARPANTCMLFINQYVHQELAWVRM